jgi:hypothetical protein
MTPAEQFLRLSEDAEAYSADARQMLLEGNIEAARKLHDGAAMRMVAATKIILEMGTPDADPGAALPPAPKLK